MIKSLMIVGCSLILSFTFLNCSKKGGGSTTPAPVANFTYSGAGTAPSTITFTNTSTNASSYSWDFGDNGTSTSASPTHTYTQGGVFTVRLTAVGNGGSNTVTKTINISTPTNVKVTAITVVQMSFTNTNGGGWDNNSGPDVYYTITDASDNVLVNPPTYSSNVTAANLPFAMSVNPAFQATNFATVYKVKIWDYDGNDFPPTNDEFIGGYQFSFSGFAALGYPTTATLFVTGSTLKLQLSLQWQ